MTHRATDNSKALNAFLAAKHEIDGMLERLATLSADHFETSPDEIHWGHVGTLNHYRAKLREITDSAFKEGDYAEWRHPFRDTPANWRAWSRRSGAIVAPRYGDDDAPDPAD